MEDDIDDRSAIMTRCEKARAAGIHTRYARTDRRKRAVCNTDLLKSQELLLMEFKCCLNALSGSPSRSAREAEILFGGRFP